MDKDSLREIFDYAINFDGYAHTESKLGIKCSELGNTRLQEYHSTGQWRGTFEELRCCLFYEQRRDHMARITGPTERELAAIKALYWAVVSRWYFETEPVHDVEAQ